MSRPRIGICATPRVVDLPFGSFPSQTVFDLYVERVVAAGGVPVVLPCLEASLADDVVAAVDGLLLTGGADVGELPDRDGFETAVVLAALGRRTPLLGVCRGLQLTNVALGGTLLTDVDGHQDPAIRHRVTTEPGSTLASLVGEAVATNSLHHQAVDVVAASLRVTGRADDGIVEALEGSGFLGVQWHPELDVGVAGTAPFDWLISMCNAEGSSRRLT